MEQQTSIPPDARAIILRGAVIRQLYRLPPVNLGALYDDVHNALILLGGTWSKKQRGYLFANGVNVGELLGIAPVGEPAVAEPDEEQEAPPPVPEKQTLVLDTPPGVADRMVKLAEIKDGMFVLNPGCGQGVLLRAIFEAAPGALVTGVDIDPLAIAEAGSRHEFPDDGSLTLYVGDFLDLPLKSNDFDRAVLHPPLTLDSDLRHIARALYLLEPGGTLVAIMLANTGRTKFQELISLHDFDIESLPEGTFEQDGQNIPAMILVIRKRPNHAWPRNHAG